MVVSIRFKDIGKATIGAGMMAVQAGAGALSKLGTGVRAAGQATEASIASKALPLAAQAGIGAEVHAIATRFGRAARVHASEYPYGWHTVRDLAQVAGSGAAVWLAWKGKRAAIPVSIATAAAVAGLSALSEFRDPQPAGTQEADARRKVIRAAVDSLPNIAGAATFALAPSARNALTAPLDFARRDPLKPFSRMDEARNLVMLYGVYTMVGHWLEMAFCELIRLGIVDGDYDRSNTMLWDWWLHPFPAEGIAGVLIALLLSPLREHLLKLTGGRTVPALAASFLVNQVACTSIDYLTGMVANRNYELWDYREMPFNFQGQVCLQNSLVYTAAATLVAWVAYPARQKWLRVMPDDATNLMAAAFLPVYAFLCQLYFI